MIIVPRRSGRTPLQMCWVVPDLDAAIRSWIRVQGVGPWFWFECVTFDEGYRRGHPAAFPNIRAAIAQAGEVQIELVAHKDRGDSFFRTGLSEDYACFHDVAWHCEDFDEELAAYSEAGVEIAFIGSRDGMRTCWLDTTPLLGFMTQLTERSEATENAFRLFRNAARNWNGTEPIRKLA